MGAAQLCPARQKALRPGLSGRGVQTQGRENASLAAPRLFQGLRVALQLGRVFLFIQS